MTLTATEKTRAWRVANPARHKEIQRAADLRYRTRRKVLATAIAFATQTASDQSEPGA